MIGSQKNLLILASYAESLIRFRGDLIKSLIAQDIRVHAAAPNLSNGVKHTLTSWGCYVHQVKLDRTGVNPLKDLRSTFNLYRLMRKLRPTVFLGYTIKPVIYGTLAAWFARIPCRCAMITGLGSMFSADVGNTSNLTKGLARRLYSVALRKAHVIFFQNPDDMALFHKMEFATSAQSSLINGSGVNTKEFAVTPMPSDPVFLLIARLITEKGVREYVDAAKQIRSQIPSAEFHLVGWFDDRPGAITQKELEDWQSAGIIRFHGKLDDVRPAIADSSIYVLPSYYREGTPRTVLEAMSMGRPIITTDSPGCRETVVDGKNGYLIEPRNVTDLVTAMLKLGNDPKLRLQMGKESRKIAEEKYDVDKVNKKIIEALNADRDSMNQKSL